MANVIVNDTNLTNIASAIREKNGESTTYKPSEMAAAILAITTGGGGSDDCNGLHIPEEALVLTGAGSYRFANDTWNWFIEQYGNQITTKDMNQLNNMFYGCYDLTSIPFDINIMTAASTLSAEYMFYNCQKLKEVPRILNLKPQTIGYMFAYCYLIREIPDDYFDTWDWSKCASANSAYGNGTMKELFAACHSLRSIPEDLFAQNRINRYLSYNNCLYNGGFHACCVLDKIKLPVYDKASWTSNAFKQWITLSRLSSLTFNTNEDGSPIVVTGSWKKQTFDLTNTVGYQTESDYDLNGVSDYAYLLTTEYNSGITPDKEVKDEATYAALKTDPDWFTCKVAYSRYNHDSAVETINTLPDVTSGSDNIIKFKGDAGSATDGGAINTLTDAEIAVAAAKGWTVTLA